MRILGTTSSNFTDSNVDYSTLIAPFSQPAAGTATKSATVPAGFASGNGYYAAYGGAAGSTTVSYTTSLSGGTWSTITGVNANGAARGISYIDTGSNKYWVYGNDTNGKFTYTTDGTPFGARSEIDAGGGANATGSTMMVYCAGAARPFVAVGGHATTGIYIRTATAITGPWASATHTSQSVGNSGVQGIVWGGTGTGSDKRLIMVIGGNGAGATYFSAANDTTSYTLQTVTGGDCRGLAYTGTHWIYLGDNQLGRAPAASFNNTTGNAITYSTYPAVFPGTKRGLAATPNGNGVCYASGGGTAVYSTDHGANWSSASETPALASQVKMYIDSNNIIAYSSADANISYRTYA
jgi:hypothetical protein